MNIPKSFFSVLFFCLYLFTCSSLSHADESAAKFLPPDGKTLVFIGQDKTSIQRYFVGVGVKPAGFTFYTSIQEMDGIFQTADYGAGIQHAQYFTDRYPNMFVHIGLYMVGAVEGVPLGRFDSKIVKLANWAKDINRPIFLRIGYEFDNPQNFYDPEQYIAAYKYIFNKLKELGVDNIAYVWHSYASKAEHPLESWYPGDEYVDYIAVSFFGAYNDFGMEAVADFAQKRNKPFMIAESTPVKMSIRKGEYTWKRWFEFVFRFIEKHDVKIFSYINCHWDHMGKFEGMKWGDARIEMNKFIKEKWQEKIQTDRFINLEEDNFSLIGFEPKEFSEESKGEDNASTQ